MQDISSLMIWNDTNIYILFLGYLEGCGIPAGHQ